MCIEGAPIPVSVELRDAVIAETHKYVMELYGPTCVVCLRILEKNDEYVTLHITSPHFPDMLLNTSAFVTFDSNGNLTDKGYWHSCYVRRTINDEGESGDA